MLRNELLYPTATKQFLAENQHRFRTPESRNTYRRRLATLQAACPGKRVSEFREADLLAYCGNPKLAPSSQRGYRDVIISFFQWAHGEGMVDRDPSVRLKQKLRPPNVKVRLGNWLTAAELPELLAVCDDGTEIGKRDRTILATDFLTGLRVSALASLRWGHVDLRSKRLAVKDKGGKITPKGLPASLVECLMEWRSLAAKGLGRPVGAGDPVFPRAYYLGGYNGTGERSIAWDKAMGHQGIRDVFQRRGEAAGWPTLRPHDGRRTMIGIWAEQFGLEIASKAAGHANLGTTEVYLRDNPNRHVEAGQGLEIAL